MNKGFPFHQFNSPLHRAWKADRRLRQCIPLSDSTRGCVGLAALWNDIDAAENHGEKVLYPNEDVSWIALRDLPPGCFPHCANMNRRDVNYASTAVAKLVHGMPCIDFSLPTRDAVDFRMMPFSAATVCAKNGKRSQVFARGDVLNSKERLRDFGILNELSRQMTEFAFNAQDDRGRPVKPAWFRRGKNAPVQRIVRPAERFPKAYLAFDEQTADSLYGQATDVNFTSTKPSYAAHDLDRSPRQFSYAFKAGFCAALSSGLPLSASEKCRYLGVRVGCHSSPNGSEGLGLVCHEFLRSGRSDLFTIYLPPQAIVQVSNGDVIDKGEIWCVATPSMAALWRDASLTIQWKSLHDLLGDRQLVGYLKRLWFQQQAVRLEKMSNRVLFPAALVAPAVGRCQPADLFWDFAPTETLVNASLDAVIFPPLRASRWHELNFNVGEVRINGAVGDPRFTASEKWQSSARTSHQADDVRFTDDEARPPIAAA